ncbi:CPBP family intramembrane metalloprotease [Aeromicrobium sp. YIM 150415]|uniref:CPBP family intramembrane glutamic endopeptidase n=1 Tax=Aeromicrobium sp. YIM 150415 TaxID=2803912 RepID=UPI001966B313|nr:type II CAAX endopeptidase family protein [Aeromicrobium sp. YIM 150415]MBM9463763.1 CPBP family intramembrane metalloprotease [Aeromicrobium sp. YIM 150415]
MATRFHRLARESTDFAHWKLPVAAVLAVCFFFAASIVLVLGALVVVAIDGSPGGVDDFLDATARFDLLDPGIFAFAMVSIIVMVPSVWSATAIVWRRHARYLLSVEGRLRWGWLARCALIAVGALGVAIGGAVAMEASTGPLTYEFTGRSALMIVLVLLLVPLQSAAEEYAFRGFGLQLIGSWVRSPVLPLLVTTLVFAAGHIYEFWGLVDVAVFGLTAGWLTIRTGGLEAAIAVHVVNNVLLFVLGAVGLVDPTGEQGDLGPVDVLPTVVAMAVIVALVEWQARRVGLVTERAPQPPRPVPPVGPATPPRPPVTGPPAGPPMSWPPQAAPPPRHPVVPVPPNAPDYPGQLTPGWPRPGERGSGDERVRRW